MPHTKLILCSQKLPSHLKGTVLTEFKFSKVYLHTPGSAKSAADFSRMKKHLSVSLMIKCIYRVILHVIEIKKEAETPQVSLANFANVYHFVEELPEGADENFNDQLKFRGHNDQLPSKTS